MSKHISLFSGYDQKENRTTNYCLLVLRMLYEENPKFLSQVLSTITNETVGGAVGVQFLQQQRKNITIPDGLILQKPLLIYIETKNFDWFYDSQLEGHLKSLAEESNATKVLIALSNFEANEESRFSSIRALCQKKYSDTIFFETVSFEGLLNALKALLLPKNLADAVADFENYLNEQNLLASWSDWMDVANCGGLPDDVLKGNVYMCPATGGAYNHRRCKYFGMYRNKRVELVALIRGVVDVESPQKGILKWNNDETPSRQLEALAIQKVAEWRPGNYPTRVFVLGPLHSTNFFKATRGGMMGSKQYFNLRDLKIEDASDLALKLNGKTWPREGYINWG